MECHCLRCGHTWEPRIERRPLACPQCKSRTWDSPPSRSKREMESMIVELKSQLKMAKDEIAYYKKEGKENG